MNPKVRDFITLAVRNVVGVVAHNMAARAQVELRMPDRDNPAITIAASNDGELRVVLGGLTDEGQPVPETTFVGFDWEALCNDVTAALPEGIFAQERILGYFTGEPVSGQSLRPAVGDSDTGEVVQVSSLPTSIPDSHASRTFVERVVATAFEFLALNPKNAVRLKMQGSKKNWPDWADIRLVDFRDGTSKWYATSNDGCLLTGMPPSLCIARPTLEELQPLVAQHFALTSMGAGTVSAQVFRELPSGNLPVLEGSENTGELVATEALTSF